MENQLEKIPVDEQIGPVKLLRIAFEKIEYLTQVSILPLFGKMIVARRMNDKKTATVEMMVPDEWVKNINGKEEQRGRYYLIYVPKIVAEVIEALKPEDAETQ